MAQYSAKKACEVEPEDRLVADIILARRLGQRMLRELEACLEQDEAWESQHWIWGDKETLVNVWNKVSTTLLKLVEAEAKWASNEADLLMDDSALLEDEDKDILKAYVARHAKKTSS